MSLKKPRGTISPYEPEEIEVDAPKGRPETVLIRKRPAKVREVLNVWRIDEEWWRRPVSRLYFSLEMANGARVTLFCDLLTSRWYRQNWV
ncbi:MAG: hypothetical protein ABSE25_14160 [Syntrophorhabdales bacterium]|jgi:hypothetical protein